MKNKLVSKILFAAFLVSATIACSSAATNLNINAEDNSAIANADVGSRISPTPNTAQTAPDA